MARSSGRKRAPPTLFEAGPAASKPDASCLSHHVVVSNEGTREGQGSLQTAADLAATAPLVRFKRPRVKGPRSQGALRFLPQAAHNVPSEICLVCGDGGTLIGCDDCERNYHAACLNMLEPTAQDHWSCPLCNGCAGCLRPRSAVPVLQHCIGCASAFCLECTGTKKSWFVCGDCALPSSQRVRTVSCTCETRSHGSCPGAARRPREYVQHPICLKDMEEKNEQGKFSAIDEFEDDLNLLHANCVSYCANRFDSIIEDCTNMMKVARIQLKAARRTLDQLNREDSTSAPIPLNDGGCKLPLRVRFKRLPEDLLEDADTAVNAHKPAPDGEEHGAASEGAASEGAATEESEAVEGEVVPSRSPGAESHEVKSGSLPGGEEDEPVEEYEVESILDKRVLGEPEVTEYMVKWKGFGMDECTWERSENLEGAARAVAAYERKEGAAEESDDDSDFEDSLVKQQLLPVAERSKKRKAGKPSVNQVSHSQVVTAAAAYRTANKLSWGQLAQRTAAGSSSTMSNWQSGSKRLSAAKSRQIDLKVHRWLQEQSEHSMSPAKAAKKIRSTQEQDPPLLQMVRLHEETYFNLYGTKTMCAARLAGGGGDALQFRELPSGEWGPLEGSLQGALQSTIEKTEQSAADFTRKLNEWEARGLTRQWWCTQCGKRASEKKELITHLNTAHASLLANPLSADTKNQHAQVSPQLPIAAAGSTDCGLVHHCMPVLPTEASAVQPCQPAKCAAKPIIPERELPLTLLDGGGQQPRDGWEGLRQLSSSCEEHHMQLQEKQSLNKATFYEASNEQLEALQQELHELQSAPPKRRKATEGRQEQLSAEISCIRSRSIDVKLPEAEAMDVSGFDHWKKVSCSRVELMQHGGAQAATMMLKNARDQTTDLCTAKCIQSLRYPIKLPPAEQRNRQLKYGERGFSHVQSLSELVMKLEEARDASRLLIVAVGDQHNYWETMFSTLALRMPRVVFASITASAANTGSSFLREALLGIKGFVIGVRFISITPNWSDLDHLLHSENIVRAFDGGKLSTENIEFALLNRYRASLQSGTLPKHEQNGLDTHLLVNPSAAQQLLLSKVPAPRSTEISYRLRDAERCPEVGPFAIPSSEAQPVFPNPPQFKLALREEQLKSLNWMVAMEEIPRPVMTQVSYDAELKVPPLQGRVLEWRLRAEFAGRGGILADSIGFGKTAVALALIDVAPGRLSAPPRNSHVPPHLVASKATLIVVPPHLVDQWRAETQKFAAAGRLKLVVVTTVAQLKDLELDRLKNADIVLVSQQLFVSKPYQALFGGSQLADSAPVDDDAKYLKMLETLWAKNHSKKKRDGWCLERFYWHRLIVDELHEALGAGKWAAPIINGLFARSRWGLTGTPPVAEPDDVALLARFFQMGPPSSCAEFVSEWVHSSTMPWDGPAVEERVISVPLTAEERVLYRHARFERDKGIRNKSASVWEQLLQLCSHPSLESSSVAVSALDQVEETRRKKERRKIQLNNGIEKLQATMNDANSQIRHLQADINVALGTSDTRRVDACRLKMQAQVGRKEEASDGIQMKQTELKDIQSSLDFFEEQFNAVQRGEEKNECPVCLETLEIGTAVITTCSHLFCHSCAEKLVATHGQCASCREPLTDGSFKLIEGHMSERVNEDIMRKYGQYGSKLAHIIECLHSIRQSDPTAKCLVYCQWDALLNKVQEALRQHGIQTISLTGHTNELAGKIKSFTDPDNATDWVLMCSLQKKAAGMNLTCANHVIFVHPFFSLTREHSAAWEAQAIGRVQRFGQKKQVYVHRFVTSCTVENELVVAAGTDGWKKYFDKIVG